MPKTKSFNLTLEEVKILYNHYDKKAEVYVEIYQDISDTNILAKADAAIDIAGDWEIAKDEFNQGE